MRTLLSLGGLIVLMANPETLLYRPELGTSIPTQGGFSMTFDIQGPANLVSQLRASDVILSIGKLSVQGEGRRMVVSSDEKNGGIEIVFDRASVVGIYKDKPYQFDFEQGSPPEGFSTDPLLQICWGLGMGARHSEYTLSGSHVLSAFAERYWGNFRGAYTLYSGRPEGASSAASHRLQLNYYYADRSSVGLSYTNGREVENVGPPRGVLTSDVESWVVSGQHWLAPAWALTYDLVNHEQGSLYRRQGLRLGIRHSF